MSDNVSNILFTCVVGEKTHRQPTLQVELVNSLSVLKGLIQIQPKKGNLLLQKLLNLHQW